MSYNRTRYHLSEASLPKGAKKMIKHIIKNIRKYFTLKYLHLRLTTRLDINLMRPGYKKALKRIKHIIKKVIRSINLKDFLYVLQQY